MLNPFSNTINRRLIIQKILLFSSCFFPQNVVANNFDYFSNSSILITEKEKNITHKNKSKAQSNCPSFYPLKNRIEPNTFFDEKPEVKIEPTSNCAADLLDVNNSKYTIKKSLNESLMKPEPTLNLSELLTNNEEDQGTDTKQWHFKLQPYATVPINTYGTVSARGKTVSYHLTLGELLDSLRATASGRFEGWNGHWGFIIDGYFYSLQGIGNLSIARSGTSNPINILDFLLNRGIDTELKNVINILDQDITLASEIKEIRESQPLQELQKNVDNFRVFVDNQEQNLQELQLNLEQFKDELGTGRQKIEVTQLKLENITNIDLGFDRLERVEIDRKRLFEIIALQVQDSPKLDNLQELNERIINVNKLPDFGELRDSLLQTRDNLEQLSQGIRELQEQLQEQAEDAREQLQNIQDKIQDAKGLLEREIQAVDQLQNLQNKTTTQQFNFDTQDSLKFDQGIYDFAISYHIGHLPSYELPDKPSNRSFPLLWFQPILGVRINDISIDIESISTTRISTSLLNFEATTQRNFQQSRTWFEPLLGGKLGLQISDPITFWLRGDASGFGLAGDTNISWNLLFGLDWWVQRQLSLQLGYHFYEIDYGNSNDNSDFAFEENFNGPFFSATFHF